MKENNKKNSNPKTVQNFGGFFCRQFKLKEKSAVIKMNMGFIASDYFPYPMTLFKMACQIPLVSLI